MSDRDTDNEAEEYNTGTYLILQANLLAKMKRNIINFEKEPTARKTRLDRLETRLITYKSEFSKFMANHRKLIAFASKKDKESEYFQGHHIDDFEETYLDAVAAVKEQITKVSSTRQPAVNDSAHNQTFFEHTHTESEVRLPPISLPTFSGEYTEWPSFIDRFNVSIHKRSSLTDANKFVYLKSALSGEALTLINGLATTDANYSTAMELLSERYENKRVIFNHAMNAIVRIEPMRRECTAEFNAMLGTVDASIKALESVNIDRTVIGVMIAYLLCQKVPMETLSFIEQNVASQDEILKYDDLKKILCTRIRSLDVLSQTQRSFDNNGSTARSSSSNHSKAKKSVNSYHFAAKPATNNQNNQSTTITCKLCSSSHPIRECNKFLAASTPERESIVEKMRLCRNCLSQSHFVASCRSPRRCRECGQQHHTLINRSNTVNNATAVITQPSNPGNYVPNTQQVVAQSSSSGNPIIRSNHNQTVNLHSFRQVLLATTIIKVRAHTGEYVKLRALLDGGGDGTSITEEAVQLLRLPTVKQQVEVKPFGGGPPLFASKVVELDIKSNYNAQFRVNAPAVVMNTLTDILPANYIKVEKWPHLEGLELADPEFYKPAKIDLVLGADVVMSAWREGVRKGPIGTPVAQLTEFGWYLSGPISDQTNASRTIRQNHVLIDLDKTIQRFFEIESVPEVQAKSKEDEYCEEFFNRTVERTPEGRIQLRLPFRTNDSTAVLGASKYATRQKFFGLERRLKTNAAFREEYTKGMQDYIIQNHMELALDTEEDRIRYPAQGEPFYESYYIPHHAVVKESSTTTKLRNVFNASAKSANGKSLNDILHPGPVMLADLNAVLLNWRCHRIAFVADIAQMYRQMLIHPEDTTYQRLLWRNDCNDELKEYKMTRLTFGTNFAPSFAIMGLHYIAKQEETTYPKGADVIRHDTYMDDTMSGGATVNTALRVQRETIDLLASAKLELRKFAANTTELLEAVPESARELNVQLNKNESIKALGIFWNTALDTLSFRVNVDSNEMFTKRAIMSTICKLFDPLGLVSPIVSRAKMLMKEIWRSKCDWDEAVSTDLQTAWSKYLSDLHALNEIKIDRWLCFSPNFVSLQLHGFCDASLNAYGAVVYLRVIDESNRIHTSLVTSKSRVAPMTQLTIPRLELCGAVVLAELMHYVCRAIRHFSPVEIKYWTDSKTALQWIQSDPSRWQMFVSNRVIAIQSTSQADSWHHVRTYDNPADLISRGSSPEELQASELWWYGPNWLRESESQWPKSLVNDVDPLEEKKTVHINTVNMTQIEYMDRFSTLRKLIRTTAWFRRFFEFLRKKEKQFTGTLSATELHSTTLFWIRIVQQQSFAHELAELASGEKSHRQNRLIQLHPFIDKDGILRVGGRLRNSALSYNEKHPIILPDKHHFTKLVIDSAHLRTMHGGGQLVKAYINRTYWILNAKRTIASRIHRCVICHRLRAKFSEQLMADLPSARVTISEPFTHVGVDFCGPFLTRCAKGRGIKTTKSYVAVFVCLCVKAIHLELVSDLSTDTFLASFRRFISRRGLPKCMYSDCGTNFVGARKVIRNKQSEYDEFINEISVTALANEGIEWKFNPPASPHFGGLFEAGVKSTKYHLKRVLGNASLTFEEFYTVLTEVEACLNSRPLVPQSEDPNDLNVITPGHFLIGQSLLALPEASIHDENVAIGNRFRLLRKLRDQFWVQWSHEYLHRLQHRPKWCRRTENIKINDMVLLRDERLPPTKWALARVIATHPGSDGLVRVVTIKTATGEFKRPIAKLSVLPIYEEENQPACLN